MPFSIRPFRRSPVQCPVTYNAGPFQGQGTVWNFTKWFTSFVRPTMRHWLRNTAGILTLLMIFSLSGCRTTTIPFFDAIPVPPGLTLSQVEVAILSALANTPVPKELSEGADIADRAMGAFFGPLRYQSAGASRSQEWYPESRQPGQIVAGMNARSHYLQVRLDFDATAIRPSISSSRNLSQSETRIHTNAIEWTHRLEDRIRRSVGFMSAYGARTEPQQK